MTKKKKITIIVWTVCIAFVLAFWLSIIWTFFGRSIKIYFKSHTELPRARAAAAEYIEKKYGEKPDLSEYDTLTGVGGYIFPERYFEGFEFILDGCSVKVYCNNRIKIIDNRQYDEVCSAVREHYLYDDALGSSYTEKIFFLDFDYEGGFISEYFDGDIEGFINKTKPKLGANITYEGYPEKRGEYRELLTEKLERVLSEFDETSWAYIFIHDPELNLPEVKNKFENPSRIYRIPRYEEYMELIAYGYIDEKRARVAETQWYGIDEYTAISCETSPIVSDSDFIFREVDLSDNTTAYRGEYRYDDRAEENILQIRDKGYEVEFTDKREQGITIFLRLEREHYSITENTVPLLVCDGSGNWEGKRLYTSIGYGEYDSKDMDWYYLDDDYLYLYINGTYVSSWDAYLTFTVDS